MDKIFNLELFAGKCIIEIIVNDLLLLREDASKGCSITNPLNTELVGNNELKIVIFPTIMENGQLSTISDVELYGFVKEYDVGTYTGPDTGTILLSIVSDDIKIPDLESDSIIDPNSIAFPTTIVRKFGTSGISFENRLVNAQKIDDKNSIVEYAMSLREILKNKNSTLLLEEYKPKLDDYVKAYPHEFPSPQEWFYDLFDNNFFPGEPVVEFEVDDIIVRPWCQGRIWEVFRKPYQPFFMNKGLTGYINSIELYVGMVDGELKIVR